MVEVINLKTCKDWGKPGDVKIDRSTKWGNPFCIGIDGDRNHVCNMYEHWFERAEHLDIKELKDAKRLGCWCKRQDKFIRCHGDYLKTRIEELNKTKQMSLIE
jgi:hypothetical protein